MARRATIKPALGFLDVVLDADGEPPHPKADACETCRLFTLPLEQIGELYRMAPMMKGRPRGGG